MHNIKEKLEYLKSITGKESYEENELKIIETKFKEFYEDLVLFLISKKDRYYGYIIMNLKLHIDFKKDVIAGVSNMNNIPFDLIINPLLFLEFSLKEMLFILCHEIEHLVLNHPSEMKRLNPSGNIQIKRLLNYAMDASINQRLIYEIKNHNENYLSCPKKCITLNVIKTMAKNTDIKDLQDYLYYYNFIKKVVKPKPIHYILVSCNGNDNSGIITPYNSTHSGEEIFEFSGSYEELKEITKDVLKEVYENIKQRSKGSLPLYQKHNIEQLLKKTKINWKDVLRQYIGNINEEYKKTKTRLNRRQPKRFDLSGRISKRIIKLVVAIDTSGSMSIEQIEKVMNEIYCILKNRKSEITLIFCDCQINEILKIKNKNELYKIKSIKGRGGTSYKPVIDYINKNSYYRDSVLIYFTDGFGDDQIDKPKTYRNLWVVLDNINNLSIKEPFGKVMKL